ncbi:hypothetical protein ACA910_012641 [Epithemia clementina (nom. ined.)]
MGDDEEAADRDDWGFNKKRRGWEGQEMELQHSRDTWKKDQESGSTAVAVDLEQFRNHQVGEGYQAKFVVRQQYAHEPARKEKIDSVAVVDILRAKRSRNDETGISKSDKKRQRKNTSDEILAKYLECEGLRQFRKELEKIVNSS